MRYIVPSILVVAVLGLVGVVSLWTKQALLAPSLGAAVFTQMLHANERSARPYNLAVGQIVGGIAGFIGVYAAGQVHAGLFTGAHSLPAGRIVAVVIAGALAAVMQIALGAETPTGGATALIIALGYDTATLAGGLRLLSGIVLVVGFGEMARRVIVKTVGEPP